MGTASATATASGTAAATGTASASAAGTASPIGIGIGLRATHPPSVSPAAPSGVDKPLFGPEA